MILVLSFSCRVFGRRVGLSRMKSGLVELALTVFYVSLFVQKQENLKLYDLLQEGREESYRSLILFDDNALQVIRLRRYIFTNVAALSPRWKPILWVREVGDLKTPH